MARDDRGKKPDLDEFDELPDAGPRPPATPTGGSARPSGAVRRPDLDEFDRLDEAPAPKLPSGVSARPRSTPDLDEFDAAPPGLEPPPAVETLPPPLPVPPRRPAAAPVDFADDFERDFGKRAWKPPPGMKPSTRRSTPATTAPKKPTRHPGRDDPTWVERAAGPEVARLFHRLLALNFAIAFWSLWRQADVLIGARGLSPIAETIEVLRVAGRAPWQFPTHFWWNTGDAWVTGGAAIGLGLSIAAFLGILPRILLLVLTPLYLSYCTAAGTFLAFQWDSLLVEAGLLAVFLPRDVRAPAMHFAMKLLLFKLYFESGLAKWQSHLGDWQDGSAMTHYFQTAPLPTPLAWYAHHLPDAWHHVESLAVLALELFVPFFVFGPKAFRRVAFVALTGFQVVNFATANYGFFITLSLALHVFLLDDDDVRALKWWLLQALRMPTGSLRVRGLDWRSPRVRVAGAYSGALVALGWAALSVLLAVDRFVVPRPASAMLEAASSVTAALQPFRVVNNYHLFGHITELRVEPDFQTSAEGAGWTSQVMHYKPGPEERAPPFVAPHQPRVDFRLWFYGLSFERGRPEFVGVLLDRLCHDPEAVQPLFASPLPSAPDAVRLRFLDTTFTAPVDKGATGHWWRTKEVAESAPMTCRPELRDARTRTRPGRQ